MHVGLATPVTKQGELAWPPRWRVRNQASDLTDDDPAIAKLVKSETVLVTGAGGCIGSEICRQVLKFEPKTLVLVERAENSLFHIHRELVALSPTTQLVPCVADVLDRRRMSNVLRRNQPRHHPLAIGAGAGHQQRHPGLRVQHRRESLGRGRVVDHVHPDISFGLGRRHRVHLSHQPR